MCDSGITRGSGGFGFGEENGAENSGVLLFSEPKYAMETCLPFSLGIITKINRYR